MKNSDYVFGNCDVSCDGKNCNAEERIEGFDGHPPQFSDVNNELRQMGWTIKRENGEWKDLCSDCSNK